MIPRVLSWAFLRAVILGVGLPFLAVSLGSACLDYAGEELMRVCEVQDASTNTGASGSGSGSILLPKGADAGCGIIPSADGGAGTAGGP